MNLIRWNFNQRWFSEWRDFFFSPVLFFFFFFFFSVHSFVFFFFYISFWGLFSSLNNPQNNEVKI